MSKVLRPNRNALAWLVSSVTNSPTAGSGDGACQPPCVKDSLGSSSGPPGACITPWARTDVGAVAESCSAVTEYGAKHRIGVICENHGGPSSDPNALIALMKAVGNPNFGTLPDFGNFPKEGGKYKIDIYDAIKRMMPYAKGVSAKSYDFDDKGQETTLDYPRIMGIVADAKYHGFVGIEYEGSRLSEPEGIKATKRLLEEIRAKGSV